MKIIPIVAGILDTNCFLVVNTQKGTAVLIDAPPESKEIILGYLEQENCKLEAILLTHSHWDHSADANPLKTLTDAKVFVHALDNYRLEEPMKHTIFDIGFEIEPCRADTLLEGEEILEFETITFRVVHTPGHTEGSVVYVCDQLECAFAGDTIFYLSVGRSDLPGGNPEQLQESINRLLSELPENYTLYVGHYQETSVGFEKIHNPYLMLI